MCIRPNGQLHVQLRPAGEVIFVPLATVRATPSLMEMRLMPLLYVHKFSISFHK